MENKTMNPVSKTYAAMPSFDRAAALVTAQVAGAAVRPAAICVSAVDAAPKTALTAVVRDRAHATGFAGKAGDFIAGTTRPGPTAWSPPL